MLNFNSDSALGLTSDQLNASVPTAISGSQPLFPESSQPFVKQRSFNLIGGGEGDDILDGGTDQNWLAGSAGNDILIDSDGGDLMVGGEGADRFWINSWDSLNTPSTILDFNAATDTLKISGSDVSFDSLTFEQVEGKTTISEQGNPLATLIGVDKDSLTSENFSFSDTPQTKANQFQTIDTDIAAIKVPNSEDTLNGNINTPNFNFPDIEEFFSSYISNILGSTTLEDLLNFMGGEPTSDDPSSISSYSNSGDITASLMEQQASGKPFAEVMQDTIEPSTSDDKHYGIPEKIDGNHIPGYIYQFDGLGIVG